VACGWAHTLVLASDGSVYGWGGNGNGCLGHGHTDNQTSPAKVTAFEDGTCTLREPLKQPVRIAQIAAAVVSAAVSFDGLLYVWGQDEFVSHPDPAHQALCKPLPFALLEKEKITRVSLGNQHAAVLTQDGKVMTWGNSSIGRLGNELPTVHRVPVSVPLGGWRSVHMNVIKVGGVNKRAAVECGANHTVLLSGEERYVPELGGSNLREALAAIFEAYCGSIEVRERGSCINSLFTQPNCLLSTLTD
jgi:alpha-tubulin suppressor-like RCC1 family protein